MKIKVKSYDYYYNQVITKPLSKENLKGNISKCSMCFNEQISVK